MSYVAADPAEQNQQPAPGAGGANPLAMQAPVTTSTAPGAGPAAPSGGSGASTNSNQTPAQPFTNLQTYLTANAPQIAQMGQTIAGQQADQYGKVMGDINAGKTSFEGDVNAGYTPANPDLISRVSANPTEVAANPADTTSFQALFNDTYAGPTSFETSPQYASLASEVQGAASKANLLNTPAGIQTYLGGVESNPTPGDTTLDQVLLSGSPEAVKTMKDAAAPVAALPGYLSGVVPGENTAVSRAQTAADAARAAARTGLTTAGDTFTKSLADELSGAQSNYDIYNTDVGKVRGAAGDINSLIQAYLAANPNVAVTGGNDFLAPWTNLQPDTVAPTNQTVASAGDYATEAALQKLAGSGGAGTFPIDSSTASSAGTFALPQDLQAAIANGAVPAAMTAELKGMSDQLTSAYKPYQDLMAREMTRSDLQNQISLLPRLGPSATPEQKAEYQASQQAIYDKATAAGIDPAALGQSLWPQINEMAQGLQWLPQASQQYNDLVAKLQADIQGLSGMNVPQQKVAAPSQVGKEVGDATGTAIGVGAPAAAAAGVTAASVPLTASELAASGLPVAGAVPAAGLSPLAMVAPAALAAYGTSNIIQNSMDDPMKSGLQTLANTGLSLATLSLPPSVLKSMGPMLNNVLDSIGSFFGNLF